MGSNLAFPWIPLSSRLGIPAAEPQKQRFEKKKSLLQSVLIAHGTNVEAEVCNNQKSCDLVP